jgi:hypothetical protein
MAAAYADQKISVPVALIVNVVAGSSPAKGNNSIVSRKVHSGLGRSPGRGNATDQHRKKSTHRSLLPRLRKKWEMRLSRSKAD